MSQISKEQLAALHALAPELPKDAYLAGGVAVAAALDHRASKDLDIFTPTDFQPERLSERLGHRVPGIRFTGTAEGTLYLELLGVPVSVLVYRHRPLVAPALNETLGIAVASLEDLVCMKLAAIASRGLARDFWDLHLLLRHGVADGDLPSALALYQRKYAADDIGHVIRSLAYFGDAAEAPLPRGLSEEVWADIQRDFEARVSALA